MSRLLEAADEAMVEAKRKKGKDELKNLMLDAMVEEQFGWEKLVARFNPKLDINFDTNGMPPPIPPSREFMFASPSSSTDPTTPPDAEAGGGAESNGGEAIPKAEPAAKEVREERAAA